MERATPDGTDEETNKNCLDAFREYYLVHMQDMTLPYDGVISLIESLRERGVKTAVVSNKLHRAVYELCQDYFPGLIDEAIGVSVESERKPSPVNVYKALEKMNVKAEECIYIGDSEIDVQTARNAKVECIGVTWGFRNKQELEAEGCRIIMNSCDDIFDFIVN